jgi:hypothetical protein
MILKTFPYHSKSVEVFVDVAAFMMIILTALYLALVYSPSSVQTVQKSKQEGIWESLGSIFPSEEDNTVSISKSKIQKTETKNARAQETGIWDALGSIFPSEEEDSVPKKTTRNSLSQSDNSIWDSLGSILPSDDDSSAHSEATPKASRSGQESLEFPSSIFDIFVPLEEKEKNTKIEDGSWFRTHSEKVDNSQEDQKIASIQSKKKQDIINEPPSSNFPSFFQDLFVMDAADHQVDTKERWSLLASEPTKIIQKEVKQAEEGIDKATIKSQDGITTL